MSARRGRLRFGWVDAVVLALVAGAVAVVGYRLDAVLEYRWDWSVIPQYLFRWDADEGRWVPNLLIQGFLATIRLAVGSVIPAAMMGIAFGVMRTRRRLLPRLVSRSYVELVRNTPPLVFIFVFYFFISSQIMPLLGVETFVRGASPGTLAILEFLFGPPTLIPNVVSGVLCLALFQGAYMTEIVRAGIQSIPRTQADAGLGIGLSRFQLWRHVILPQALRRVIPPLAGQFLVLVKDSSILSLISVQELTFLSIETAVSTGRVFEVWITVAGMYFCLCAILSRVFDHLERRAAEVGT